NRRGGRGPRLAPHRVRLDLPPPDERRDPTHPHRVEGPREAGPPHRGRAGRPVADGLHRHRDRGAGRSGDPGGRRLGNALFFAVGSFGMGAMMRLDPLISQAVGAGNQSRARRLLWQGLWLSLALFALALPVILLMPGLLTLMG